MATFEQSKYCTKCKKTYYAKKIDRCPVCNQKLVPGTWSARFRVIENGKEKQKRLSGFKTKKEAETAFVGFKISENKHIDDLDFPILMEKYKEHSLTRLKESSCYDNFIKINNHIFPFFKDFTVNNIKPIDILNWQNSIKNYSFRYKKNLRVLLSGILKYGERYYNLRNELSKVEFFRNLEQKKEMQVWSPNEFQKFINLIESIEYSAFFTFLYLTGCRKGEALALNVNDIDFENNKVSFNKSITRKVFDKPWKITTLKNNYSTRTIAIPNTLTGKLKKYYDSKTNRNTTFLFGGDSPLPDRTVDRLFQKYTSLANLKQIRIHDLRHSHASYLISQGISIVAVAKRLGHKNIEVTLNTYSHLMPQEEELLVKKLSFKI